MSQSAAVVLASGESVKSGPMGLAIVLVLCVVCYFLFKSMSRHLRKVRDEFPSDEPPAQAPQPAEQVQQPVQPSQPAQPAQLQAPDGE